MNKLENIFIFTFLMYSERDNYISEDYFKEKMIKFIGVDKDKDGNPITVDIFREYLTDKGFKFFDFLELIDISKVNSKNLITKKEKSEPFKNYKIDGIHDVMAGTLVPTMKLMFGMNKPLIREFRLKYILD